MNCWLCRRTQGDVEREGIYESEFEEFEIEGKTITICGVCASLIEEVALSSLEGPEGGDDDFEDVATGDSGF